MKDIRGYGYQYSAASIAIDTRDSPSSSAARHFLLHAFRRSL
jgi:hypothetical protein